MKANPFSCQCIVSRSTHNVIIALKCNFVEGSVVAANNCSWEPVGTSFMDSRIMFTTEAVVN